MTYERFKQIWQRQVGGVAYIDEPVTELERALRAAIDAARQPTHAGREGM